MTYAKILKKISGPMLNPKAAGEVIADLLKAEQREYRAAIKEEKRRQREEARAAESERLHEELVVRLTKQMFARQPVPPPPDPAPDPEPYLYHPPPARGFDRLWKYTPRHSNTPNEPETFHVLPAARDAFGGDPELLRQLRQLVSI